MPTLLTVNDLREEIAKDPTFKGHSDILRWKLFYLGFKLDDGTELKSSGVFLIFENLQIFENIMINGKFVIFENCLIFENIVICKNFMIFENF